MDLEKIWREHRKRISYLETSNKKLLICFSGVPGSGKTHLAKLIEKRYKGIRITSDEIREIIKSLYIQATEDQREKALVDYYSLLLSKLSGIKNNLVILDSGIERKYDFVKSIAEKHNFPLYIIKVSIDENILAKHITIRPKEDQEHFNSEINRWKKEYETFWTKYEADIEIKSENEKDMDRLFSALDKKI